MDAMKPRIVRRVQPGSDTETKALVFMAAAFVCPHCRVFSHQHWYKAAATQTNSSGRSMHGDIEGVSVNFCVACKNYCLWIEDEMIYPPAEL
jgi:hypothetical protein